MMIMKVIDPFLMRLKEEERRPVMVITTEKC